MLRKISPLRRMVMSVFRPPYRLGGMVYRMEGMSPPPERKIAAPSDEGFRNISFTFALIALSAQVARVSGPLTQARYVAFREAFPLRGGMCGKIRRLFALAFANPAPIEHYVAHVQSTFPRRLDLFGSLVDRLFRIATAEGRPPQEAERMLARIARQLDIGAGEFSRIRERHLHPKAHEVLGVKRRTPAAALKTRYRQMMRMWHPDRFAGEMLSPEVELLLQLKSSEISRAYRRLSGRAA